jgi:hypothetical protein
MVIGDPWATPARKAKKAMPATAAINTRAEITRKAIFPFICTPFVMTGV